MPTRTLYGATYWPRRKGPRAWVDFDRAEVRDELQQLAALGARLVRLPLPWGDLQPRAARLDSAVMRALEQTLDAVADARLLALPGLFSGAAMGGLLFPRWTTVRDISADLALTSRFGPLLPSGVAHVRPLIFDGMVHETELRNLFEDQPMLKAQRYLVGEVLGYFVGHPGVWGWELGCGWELARRPSSSEAAAEWAGRIFELARERAPGVVLCYGGSLRTLTHSQGPRPDHLVQAGATPSIMLAPPFPVRLSAGRYPTFVRFIAALVTALSGTPPILSGLGLPADPKGGGQTAVQSELYGREVTVPLLDEEQQGLLFEEVLAGAARAGVPAALAAHAYDYPEPLWSLPPLETARLERGMGLLRDDGSERAAAAALGLEPPRAEPERLDLDPQEYWRAPAETMRRLWEQWS